MAASLHSSSALFLPATTRRAGVQGPLLFWLNFTGPDARTVLERSESHVRVFVQDDWQVTPFFTANLGLGWQKETSVPDNNNVAPRLGFHWDATQDGRTSVRGGYGISARTQDVRAGLPAFAHAVKLSVVRVDVPRATRVRARRNASPSVKRSENFGCRPLVFVLGQCFRCGWNTQ